MTARIGVVTFPGSLDDRDSRRAIRLAGAEPVALWHKDKDLKQVDAVVLCGGFSYGDYLRAGAIARFSPVMDTVIDQAKAGLPVLGICNGFQILTEAHLLPGAMLGNDHLHFICRDQKLRVENADTAWTTNYAAGQEIHIPLKNMDGRYVADASRWTSWRARAGSPSATWTSTPTVRSATSPASPTRRATSSA
ncbi:Phosphoribosylformylglycinamidine synthase subunit PurQ [Streptomyces glaucescens]